MANKYVSIMSAYAVRGYGTEKVEFVSEVTGENCIGDLQHLGIGRFEEDNRLFLFCASHDETGESAEPDDYEGAVTPLSLNSIDEKTLAAQLRELADYLENQ